MELKQIEYDYENADISYALQRLNTEKSITDQFYAVYMAQSNLEISREELINAQQSYDIIKNKVEDRLSQLQIEVIAECPVAGFIPFQNGIIVLPTELVD